MSCVAPAPFVRYYDHHFALKYPVELQPCAWRWEERPMTYWEVLFWRLFMKVPKP